MARWTNWAGTASSEVTVATPAAVTELQRVVAGTAARGRRVKAIGAGHSFTPIGVTDGVQLRLHRLSGIVHADRAKGLVTVLAGMRLHELNESLWALGLSMTNLGDIDVQTVSGAISTGTHGTGARLGGIATQVRALELVLADGSLLHCSADEQPDIFAAARVGLGALGVIATVTLQCEPAFALHAAESPAALDAVLADLDELVDANDHFEFYWFPHTRCALTKRNNRVAAGTALQPLPAWRARLDDQILSNTVFEGVNRLTTRRPALIPRANAVAARTLSAREYVDRSHRVFASPRTVRFREMEYAVPRAAVPDAAGRHRGLPLPQRRADRLPGGGPLRRGRRHLALDRLGPRDRLRRRAPVPPARPRDLLPGRRGGREGPGRAPALGQAAPPRRRVAGRDLPTARRTSSRYATSSTRTGCSATPTSTGCWADDRHRARHRHPGRR